MVCDHKRDQAAEDHQRPEEPKRENHRIFVEGGHPLLTAGGRLCVMLVIEQFGAKNAGKTKNDQRDPKCDIIHLGRTVLYGGTRPFGGTQRQDRQDLGDRLDRRIGRGRTLGQRDRMHVDQHGVESQR